MKQAVLYTIAIFCLVLNGCKSGGQSEARAETVSQSPAQPQPPTIKETITQAQKAGEVPILDTSTSIAGPDANGNLVRDDVENYINQLPHTEPQKAALRQVSAAFTAAMTVPAGNDKSAALLAYRKLDRSANCLAYVYNFSERQKMGDRMESVNVSTYNRVKAYSDFSNALSGKMLSHETGNTCD